MTKQDDKSFVNRSSKAQFRAGLLKYEHIFSEYCDASRLLRSSMGISFASTCKLVAGDVRNAPKQRRSMKFITRCIVEYGSNQRRGLLLGGGV